MKAPPSLHRNEALLEWMWNNTKTPKDNLIQHKITQSICFQMKLPNRLMPLANVMRLICCICCGDHHKQHWWRIQRWWSSVTRGRTRAPTGIGPLACNDGNYQPKVLTSVIIDRFLPIEFQISMTFSSENYYSDCIDIAKSFFGLGWRNCGPHF